MNIVHKLLLLSLGTNKALTTRMTIGTKWWMKLIQTYSSLYRARINLPSKICRTLEQVKINFKVWEKLLNKILVSITDQVKWETIQACSHTTSLSNHSQTNTNQLKFQKHQHQTEFWNTPNTLERPVKTLKWVQSFI